jgi:hypothetical protein
MLPRVAEMLSKQWRKPDAWFIIGHGIPEADMLDFKISTNVYRYWFDSSSSLAACRNHAVENSFAWTADWNLQAPFVAMIDDDDWYGPGYLAGLEESIFDNPTGDVYGIREYRLGFVRGTLAPDGSNILDADLKAGGKVYDGNSVDWACGASVAIDAKSWFRLGLQYAQPEGSAGGEDGGLWEACRKTGALIIRRPSDDFCAVRYIDKDGFGGAHKHTWGPIHYHEPIVASTPTPQAPPNEEICIYVPSLDAARNTALIALGGMIRVEPGLKKIEVRRGGAVVRAVVGVPNPLPGMVRDGIDLRDSNTGALIGYVKRIKPAKPKGGS